VPSSDAGWHSLHDHPPLDGAPELEREGSYRAKFVALSWNHDVNVSALGLGFVPPDLVALDRQLDSLALRQVLEFCMTF
jgi:hypothetical protein